MRAGLVGLAAAGLLVLAAPARAQDRATQTLAQPQEVIRQVTLDEALRLAVRGQPAMVQARQDARVADAQVRQSRAAFLPSLTLNSSTGKTGGSRSNQFGVPTDVESFYSSRIGITANWDLFTGFRRGAQRTAANATSDQRDATLLRQEYATALDTKQSFFQALAFADLVTVSQTRLRSADEQLKLTTERLRLGATTRSDSLRARVEYGNAQLALINAQNNLRNAQANLARAIQVEGLVTPSYDSTLLVRVGTLDTAALLRDALAGAPSVREADASLAAASAQKRVSRAAYLPTLSMSAGNTWIAGHGTINIPGDTSVGRPPSTIEPVGAPFGGRYISGWSMQFSVSYPLFNNLSRETNSISSDAGYQAAVARARDARLALSASLTQQISSLNAAAARMEISQISVAAAAEDLRMQRERYRLGAVTIIEVLQSQANSDQAQVDFVQARYDYLVARAQIEALTGRGL